MHGTATRKLLKPRPVLAKPRLNGEVFGLIQELGQAEARTDYWAYRQYIGTLLGNQLLMGWWQREVARALMQFLRDMRSKKRPKLVIAAPPQHGKSRQIVEFISFVSGLYPDLNTIYGSYGEDLGIRANSWLQKIYDSERYQALFPNTRIALHGSRLGERNSFFLEYVGHHGSFRNTTVNGQINGMGLDLGVIDDPIKGRKEANSPVIRQSTWEWLVDDFFGRFSEEAGLIFIMTSWHVDDPLQRFIQYFPNVKVLRFEAIADERNQWPQYQKLGDPLFPEFKSKDFLLERKQVLSTASWSALYMQSPIVVGGGMFPIENFEVVEHFDRSKIKKSVRYYDKSSGIDGGTFTAGVLMHALTDGSYVIADVQHGRWREAEREARILQTAKMDGFKVHVWVEQEPGSSGKEAAERSVRMLAGYCAYPDKVTGNKEFRAEPYAAQVQNSNVKLLRGQWIRAFLDEHETFPNGAYKDQVDAAAGAFNKVAGSSYDSSYSWVG